MVAGVGTLIVGFLSNALGRRKENDWISIGPAEDLSPESFKRYVVRNPQTHAWRTEAVPELIYVKDLYPEDPLALLSTCTHLGCTVRWNASRKRFLCPCHGGVYGEQGEVLEGPPPEPLRRVEVRIEGETCYVRLPRAGLGT